MTNEELVMLIKNGHEEQIAELWEQTKMLFYKLAAKSYFSNREYFDRAGLFLDDIKQECYFAFHGAIEAYKPEKGFAFTTYFNYQLKRLLRGLISGNDVLNRCEIEELNRPIDDEDGTTLEELLADPRSSDAIAAFEQRNSYNILYEALSLLPKEQKQIIKLRFWEGLTYEEAGERLGADSAQARSLEKAALDELRRGKMGRKLKNAYYAEICSHCISLYTDAAAFRHKGLASFQSSHTSVVEDAYLRKEAVFAAQRKLESRL